MDKKVIGKKVLYLSYDGMTDPLGQSQVLPYLNGLSALGHSITLISFEKRALFDKNEKLISDLCKKNNIKWEPLFYTKRPPVFSTIKDLFKFRSKAAFVIKRDNIDILHCRSYISALVGLWAKSKYNTSFVFDMRGFWADERVDGNIWDLSNPLYRVIYKFFKRKEKEFLAEADAIISLTYNAREELENRRLLGEKIANITVIPCCVDLNSFDASAIDEAAIVERRSLLKILPGHTVLSYIGSVGTWYMLKEMLHFYKVWMEVYPSSIFLFITPDNRDDILREASSLNVPADSLRIIRGDRSEMPLLTACCDYSIFFIKPLYSKKASSPTKQGEIMAMGIPIICNASIGDTDFVISKYSAGVIVSDFQENSYKTVIEKLISTRFNRIEIRRGAEEFYSLEDGVKRYNEVYESL